MKDNNSKSGWKNLLNQLSKLGDEELKKDGLTEDNEILCILREVVREQTVNEDSDSATSSAR